MNERMILFLLALSSGVLLGVVIYQQAVLRSGLQARLREIGAKLEEIMDTGSDQRVMVFTQDKALMELAAQINRLLEDRQRLKVEYQRAQLASKRMLSNISHDIKTPLTVLLGYLEIIRLKGDPDGRLLQKVETKAHQVLELITQFFTLAKLEAGDTELELVRLEANEVCRETVLDFYELLTRNDFQVELQIPEPPCFVLADREALRRILSNLISNALRYGGAGHYLGLSLRWDDESAYIDITDKGQGIEKAYLQRVFDRLFTLEDSRSGAIQGNGLGLTIAKQLALQQGGDLTLESLPLERTTFTLRLKKIDY